MYPYCNTLNEKPETALAGTIAIQTVLIEKGASIIRTHDVKEACDSIIMMNEVSNSGNTN